MGATWWRAIAVNLNLIGPMSYGLRTGMLALQSYVTMFFIPCSIKMCFRGIDILSREISFQKKFGPRKEKGSLKSCLSCENGKKKKKKHTTKCILTSEGWSGGAKVSCILRHWGIQLKLDYIWARPTILVADKSRGEMFLFLLFLHFHSCSSFFPTPLFHRFYCPFYLFSPFLWETTQNDS